MRPMSVPTTSQSKIAPMMCLIENRRDSRLQPEFNQIQRRDSLGLFKHLHLPLQMANLGALRVTQFQELRDLVRLLILDAPHFSHLFACSTCRVAAEVRRDDDGRQVVALERLSGRCNRCRC